MDLVTFGLLVMLIFLVTWFVFRHSYDPRMMRFPQGPKGHPLIGSPWIMSSQVHKEFTKITQKWGDVFSLQILGGRTVVLNSADAIREAFGRKEGWELFSGRPRFAMATENMKNGMATKQPSAQWSRLRRLTHRILNHYGEGFEGSEERIHDELKHFMDHLMKKKGPIDMKGILYHSMENIITILLKGRRYEYGDDILENVEHLDEIINRGFGVGVTILLLLFPRLKYIPIGPGKTFRENQIATEKFLRDYFEETKATYNPDVTRGMLDFMLHTQKEADGSIWLQDKYIKGVAQEMINAGSNTTAGGLYSFFLILLNHPNVSRKLQDEVDKAVGSSRLPSLKDRSNMPYTMATINELLRYTSHLPLSIPHMTTDDVEFRGFFIPKNTTVVSNLWWIHHDPSNYPEPWSFKPERFLDGEGKFVSPEHPNRKNLMAFGLGRRACAGESFARSRLFLFISTLMQRFDFLPNLEDSPLPSCDPRTYKYGLVMMPDNYTLLVRRRFSDTTTD